MGDSMTGRLTFVMALVLVFAGAFYFLLSGIFANASTDSIKTINMQDTFKEGAHTLAGMVMVPSACHEVTVTSRDIDASQTALVFETWEEPYRTCPSQEPTPRRFITTVFAPKDIIFKSILDGVFVPTNVLHVR